MFWKRTPAQFSAGTRLLCSEDVFTKNARSPLTVQGLFVYTSFTDWSLIFKRPYLCDPDSESGDSKAHVFVSSNPFCWYHFHYVVTYGKWPFCPCPYLAPSEREEFSDESFCEFFGLPPGVFFILRQAMTDTCMMVLQ